MPTVVSVFGVQPMRIGGTETFARELSMQLGQKGWKSVLVFETEPPQDVADFLKLQNVTIEVLKDPTDFNWTATKQLGNILRRTVLTFCTCISLASSVLIRGSRNCCRSVKFSSPIIRRGLRTTCLHVRRSGNDRLRS